MIHYAAIAGTGQILGVADTAAAAAAEFVRGRVMVETVGELVDNAGAAMASRSLRVSGLSPIDEREVDRLTVAQAHEALWPYFAGLSRRGGQAVATYASPGGMTKAWIGQNYKTGKGHPEEPSDVQGLALLPHAMLPTIFEGRTLERVGVDLPAGFTFCAGSNSLCRDSCLVYAGQNAVELYNTQRKAAQSAALLGQPAAFMRIVMKALDNHVARSADAAVRPYMRMNVLSDIPWELVCPWLFALYERTPLEFYDYTKVAGRRTPPNYDLTFSFSGTNKPLAEGEIRRGRRVAVVILARRRAGDRWVSWRTPGPGRLLEIPLPRRFWGLPVVDGDVSDVRPLDPAPAIVGLRWKLPWGSDAAVDPMAKTFSFVTPVYVVDGEASLEDPFTRPNPDSDQWLVAAVTPRHQPISHDVTQPMGG